MIWIFGSSHHLDDYKNQYDELSQYWRHFNSIIWAIPTVAVTLIAGIIIGAFQKEIVGWPRFAVLAIGSAILFALTIELSRKILHMEALSYLLKDLQENALRLPRAIRFPLGVSKDIEEYIEEVDKNRKPHDNLIFKLLKRCYARKWLLYVIFFVFIAVAFIAIFVLLDIIHVNYYHLPWLPVHLAYNLTLSKKGIP